MGAERHTVEAAGGRRQSASTATRSARGVCSYTTQLERFAEINDAYAEFFGDDRPARVALGVAALPKGALMVEAVLECA